MHWVTRSSIPPLSSAGLQLLGFKLLVIPPRTLCDGSSEIYFTKWPLSPTMRVGVARAVREHGLLAPLQTSGGEKIFCETLFWVQFPQEDIKSSAFCHGLY